MGTAAIGGIVTCQKIVKSVAAADLDLNDVVCSIFVPGDAYILDVILTVTDLDTNGTPTLVLDIGDTGDDARFVSNTNIGQTGGTIRYGSTATNPGYQYAVAGEQEIQVTVSTAAATAAAGTATFTVVYTRF